jgi:hypothetical protein
VAGAAGGATALSVRNGVAVTNFVFSCLLLKLFSKEGVPFSLSHFQEFLFKAFCKRLSIIVDVEWTFSGHGADPERTGCLASG